MTLCPRAPGALPRRALKESVPLRTTSARSRQQQRANRGLHGEGITIFGWVANWRPAEILLYEIWAVRRRGIERAKNLPELADAHLDSDVVQRFRLLGTGSTSPARLLRTDRMFRAWDQYC
jgi:hypothetical protein